MGWLKAAVALTAWLGNRLTPGNRPVEGLTMRADARVEWEIREESERTCAKIKRLLRRQHGERTEGR